MILPADTGPYMPHRPPLRLVRRLLYVQEGCAEAQTTLEQGDVGVGPDGKIDAPVLMELIAQAYAAAQGYQDRCSNKPPRMGYLVGASDFQVERLPVAGQPLRIAIKTSRSFEEFFLVEGQVVSSEGHVLARGTLKVYVPVQGPAEMDPEGQGRGG